MRSLPRQVTTLRRMSPISTLVLSVFAGVPPRLALKVMIGTRVTTGAAPTKCEALFKIKPPRTPRSPPPHLSPLRPSDLTPTLWLLLQRRRVLLRLLVLLRNRTRPKEQPLRRRLTNLCRQEHRPPRPPKR